MTDRHETTCEEKRSKNYIQSQLLGPCRAFGELEGFHQVIIRDHSGGEGDCSTQRVVGTNSKLVWFSERFGALLKHAQTTAPILGRCDARCERAAPAKSKSSAKEPRTLRTCQGFGPGSGSKRSEQKFFKSLGIQSGTVMCSTPLCRCQEGPITC